MRSQIEPVDAEIIKREVFDFLEFRSDDPVVIPMQAETRARQPSDQSGFYRLTNVAEMRRPTAVLINSQLDPARISQFDQAFAHVQINYERLLA